MDRTCFADKSIVSSSWLYNEYSVKNETANELIAKGKSKWVTPRLDKIVVKGKGEMQTSKLESALPGGLLRG
jgi:hypothetical protein